MTSQTYISSLERRHQDLERKIEQEMRHPARDALLIADQMVRATQETTH
jgi:hypothetical protein